MPLRIDAQGLAPAHKQFQKSIFAERKKAALSELRMLSGLPGIVSNLKPEKVYRVVLPCGKALQKGKDGFYSGVLYGPEGKILCHAKFEKAPINLARIGSAVGSQIMLISIAMQLNRIEQEIAGIAEELHNDRIAMVLAGVRQYENAMHITEPTRRDTAIQHAIQSLTEGLSMILIELHGHIDRLPEPRNTFWENWGKSKAHRAGGQFRLAEEAFKFAVHGASVLSECYAAMDEPGVGTEAMRRCLEDISSCGVETAAEKARLVETTDRKRLPEAPWLRFTRIHLDCLKGSTPAHPTPASAEKNAVTIEFQKTELLEEP